MARRPMDQVLTTFMSSAARGVVVGRLDEIDLVEDRAVVAGDEVLGLHAEIQKNGTGCGFGACSFAHKLAKWVKTRKLDASSGHVQIRSCPVTTNQNLRLVTDLLSAQGLPDSAGLRASLVASGSTVAAGGNRSLTGVLPCSRELQHNRP